jgi:hypothetical protein
MPIVGQCVRDAFPAHGLHGNAIGKTVSLIGPSIVERQAVKKRSPALRDDMDIGIALEMKHSWPNFPGATADKKNNKPEVP